MRISGRVAAGVWGVAPLPGDISFSGVAVDSRRVERGNLFVALPGAREDGHAFVGQAAARGAAAALVSQDPGGLPAGFPLFVVPDPLRALQDLAAFERRRQGFRLAAVTGSVGKTTTKEMAAAIVSRKFRAGKTAGNANSGIGFPMAVLNLSEGLEAVCGEFGMSTKGEISTLTRLFRPDVAAITNVSAAHAGNFASIDGIAEAKWEIVEGLSPEGVLVYNAGDARLASRAASFSGKKIAFGAGGADVTADEVQPDGLSGTSFVLSMRGEKAAVRIPLPGMHQVANCLCAAAIALAWGLTAADVSAAMDRFAPPDRRGGVYRLASGAELIDDSYNASPSAVESVLASLGGSGAAGRRIAVLGDMLELGEEGPRWHRQLGAAAASRVDWLVCVGPLARGYGEGAREAGLAPEAIVYLDRAEEVAGVVGPALGAGDIVWIKGSRGIHLDLAADALRN